MTHHLSRTMWLEEFLKEESQTGHWEVELYLYPVEIEMARKSWRIDITELGKKDEFGMIPCKLAWNKAFKSGMNNLQSGYISGLYTEVPPVDNFAQELFLFAARCDK